MMVIGVDPGITGATAVIGEDFALVRDMPTRQVLVGKKRRTLVDAEALAKWLDADVVIHGLVRPVAFVEAAQATPQMGVSSAFGYGMGFGIVQGVLAAMGVCVELVHPLSWKRDMGLLKRGQSLEDRDRDKGAAMDLARKLYPKLAGELARVRDNGRADALLIAHYGAEQLEEAA